MTSFLPSTVRRHRNKQQLTLEVVAGKAGMSPQHLSEIESGKRDARLSTIERIAGSLGLTVILVPTTMAPDVRRYVDTDGRSVKKI